MGGLLSCCWRVGGLMRGWKLHSATSAASASCFSACSRSCSAHAHAASAKPTADSLTTRLRRVHTSPLQSPHTTRG